MKTASPVLVVPCAARVWAAASCVSEVSNCPGVLPGLFFGEINKLHVGTLDEAHSLMQTAEYLINLTGNGNWALRKRDWIRAKDWTPRFIIAVNPAKQSW